MKGRGERLINYSEGEKTNGRRTITIEKIEGMQRRKTRWEDER